MDATTGLLEHNESYASGFEHGELAAAPKLKVAILTCMDARIDPAALFGLAPGAAHVVRNAGGLATEDALRSLVLSRWAFGTEAILVLQHTGCALQALDEARMREEIEARTGGPAPAWLGAFEDLEESVRQAVATLHESPLLAGVDVRGAIYDLGAGLVAPV